MKTKLDINNKFNHDLYNDFDDKTIDTRDFPDTRKFDMNE